MLKRLIAADEVNKKMKILVTSYSKASHGFTYRHSFQHSLRSRKVNIEKKAGEKLETSLVQHLVTRLNKTESEPESWAHFPLGVLTINKIYSFITCLILHHMVN